MVIEKIASPISNLSDVQYKFCVPEEYEEFEERYEKRRELTADKRVHMVDKKKYAYINPFCKHCFSRNVSKYSVNPKVLIDTEGKHHDVVVQRYRCNSCGKLTQTEFEEYDMYCNISKETKEKSVKNMELDHISLRNISKMHKNFNNIDLSHESVRKSSLIMKNMYFACDIPKLSGYYGYDEQWVAINGEKWKYRYVLFDLIHNVPIAEAIYDDVEIATVKKFIEKTILSHERKVIVTDLKDDYDSLMSKLGFEHQYCSFHLSKNINKKIREYLNETKKKIEKEVEKTHPKLTKVKLKKEVETKLKPITDNVKLFKGVFLDLFKQKSYEGALNYVDRLKYILDEFPEFLAKYLKKEFFPKYKKFITFLKEPHKGKIDSTNNKTENYIGNIMPKADKNKYRTKTGLINQIYHRTKNWIKNTKNQLTN